MNLAVRRVFANCRMTAQQRSSLWAVRGKPTCAVVDAILYIARTGGKLYRRRRDEPGSEIR
jgi:hypothetical protein